jgi:molybdenum cofactor guanylyltransferase
MGRDKALLPFGPGEVLVQRVVRILGRAVPAERIVCVAAAEQRLPQLPVGVMVVRDEHPDRGPLAGLATGLAALTGRADAVFACGCDTPLLVPEFVARMFELSAGHEIAAVDDGERFHPLSAVYRTSLAPLAASLLASGERRLRALVERCDTRRVATDEVRDVDPQLSSLENCNTDDEYQQLLRAAFPPGGES